MIEDIKKIKSGKKELKEFGLVVGFALCLLAGFLFWRGKTTYPYFLSIGIVFGTLAFVSPFILKPLQKVWMGMAVVISFFMTRVILAILFFVGISPMAIVARLLGKDFLDEKIEKDRDSYWIVRKKVAFNPKNYENQF